MKIFLDWMHRKLHPMDVKYTQVPQKKGEDRAEELAELMVAEEKEALLLHDMLHGILTIGTLGQYQDPFLPSSPFEEAIGLDDDDDEEEASVVVAVEEPLGVINKKEDEEEEEEITVTVKSQEIRIVEVETKLLQEDLPLLKEDKERRERGRTTLADLFAADPAVREDANVNKGIKKSSNGDCKQPHKSKKKKKKEEEEEKKKKKKNGKSSSSKILKLMTRMLKKKIHPESITSAEPAAAKSIDNHDVSNSCSLVYW